MVLLLALVALALAGCSPPPTRHPMVQLDGAACTPSRVQHPKSGPCDIEYVDLDCENVATGEYPGGQPGVPFACFSLRIPRGEEGPYLTPTAGRFGGRLVVTPELIRTECGPW